MHDATPTDGEMPPWEGPRPARVEERDTLLAMINYVFRVSRGLAPTIARDWHHVYLPENLANVMVMCDPTRDAAAQPESASVAGHLVASTGVWVSDVVMGDHTLRVGGINCVGTLPEYRRHGLGAQVMAAAHQTMHDLGCHVGLLSTGINNWYRRLGWESAGVACGYTLNRGNIGLLPEMRPGLRARWVALADGVDDGLAAEVVRLHAAARLGARRNVRAFQQLVRARQVERLYWAEEAGQPVAYLLTRPGVIMEWAGAAVDVLGLARAAFAMLDDPHLSTSQRGADGNVPSLHTLTLETPAPETRGQHPLPTWLEARGFPVTREYLGMLYVVDPQGILDAFGLDDVELVPEQNGEGHARFVVRVRGTTLTLDRRQLAKLFFGPERVLAGESGPFPLSCWQWPLEMV